MFRNGALLLICFSLFFFSFAAIAVQTAEQYTEAPLFVDNSTSSLKQFIADPNMLAFKDRAKRAREIRAMVVSVKEKAQHIRLSVIVFR